MGSAMRGGVLAGLGLCLAASFASAGEEPGGSARDALWRSIFARPVGIPQPHDNASNPDKVSLGYDLFRDPRLSGRENRTCSSCHDPAHAFTDGKPRGVGLDGTPLRRNVPSLFNLAWGKAFYWDGRAPSLEAQARFPIKTHNEMNGAFPEIVERLAADGAMRDRFAKAFPDAPAITDESILKAIAAYERSLIAPRTRLDDWVEGDDKALTGEEHEGFAIFVGRGGCVACHGGWRFTDDAFHDIGLAGDDPGRGAVEGGMPGLTQFKTPSLRESAHTAPYMHDGSLPNLEAVADHYAGGFIKRPSLATNIRRDLNLTSGEKAALVAFLKTLSSADRVDQR